MVIDDLAIGEASMRPRLIAVDDAMAVNPVKAPTKLQ